MGRGVGSGARGGELWRLLIEAARRQEAITSATLSEQLGLPRATVEAYMRAIQEHCRRSGLPALDKVVVSDAVHARGPAAIARAAPPGSRRHQAFQFDWYRVEPPTAEELEQLRRDGESPYV